MHRWGNTYVACSFNCVLKMLTAISGYTEFSQSFSNETSYSVVVDYKPPPHLPPQVYYYNG